MAQPTHNTATTAAHEAAHDNGGFPPFNTATYPGQLIWLALTFGVLFYMMSKVIVPRLSGLIETRRRMIASDLDEAAATRARAEEAGQAYESAIAAARAKAQAIAQETKTRLSGETDSRRKTLEADLAAKLAQSDVAIRSRTEAAMANVSAIAVEAAGAIVERLTGRAPSPDALTAAAAHTKA